MTTYRRYRASYDFDARDDTEISMKQGDLLRVGRKLTGEWPNPEKFMRGVNEATGLEGDFPGGAYVEYVDEYTEDLSEDEALYDEPPPPTPPRRGPSATKTEQEAMESVSQSGPPKPTPRKPRPSTGHRPQELPEQPKERVHNWVEVSFLYPMFCSACEDLIWGSLNHGYKCGECLAICHTHCLDHVNSTQQCVPANDPSLSQQMEYAHTPGTYADWPESGVRSWMSGLGLTNYLNRFLEAGINKGVDLARLDDGVLEETIGIADEAHRQIIVECLDELCRGNATTMPSVAVCGEDTDGRHPNRLSGIFAMHRSPSIQSIQSLLGGLGKKRGDTHVAGHDFHRHTFSTPHWCDVCGRFLWGLVTQGVKCRDCGMKVHRMCMTEGIYSCEDWRARRKAIVSRPSFGLELASLFDSQSQKAPAVVLKCIEAVEARGLRSEGIYRLSPTKSVLMSLKLALDEDPAQVDILDSRWDHNVFAGALKLYLRELPDPVFTFQLYEHFVSAGKVTNVDGVYNQLLPLLDKLPNPHRSTLDLLLDHLVKVSSHESQNRMSTRNLALLFGPTLLRPQPDQIQKLIENSEVHCRVLEVLMLKTTPPPPPLAPRRPPPRPEPAAPMIPPRPGPRPLSTVYTGGGRDEIDRPKSGRDRGLPPLPTEDDPDIYMTNTPGALNTPAVDSLPPTPSSGSAHLLPLEEQGWYWADMTKEEVAAKLRDTDDGAFLVRDSSRTKGEYTLTVRKGGSNKLIRIIFSKGKYGFSEPTVFTSVPELVDFYQKEPLTKYNPRLDITLSKPVSRFAKVEDDEDDADEDREATTDSLLIKLQDISQIFDQKNDQYLQMEESYENCKKAVEKAKNNVAAKSLWLDMIKEQLRIPNESSHTGLSRNENEELMKNAKLLGTRMREAQKALNLAGRHFAETNMEFRTMDKDINTIRPELMRLQWEKEQYTIKLHHLGMSKEEINQRVKENAISESESIYGTLYGTLGEPEPDEDPWSEPPPPTFTEDPNAPPLPSRDIPHRRSLPTPTSGAPPTPVRRAAPLDEQLSPPPMIPRDRSPNRLSKLPPMRPPEDRPPPPLPSGPPQSAGRQSSVGIENPHLRKETWYCEIDRTKSSELLRNKENGTFLCRPAAKPVTLPQGGLHTHSIDIMYKGIKHLKVVQLDGKYGFSVPCSTNSLEELILRYSELSLEQHNPKLTTTLKYPVHAEHFS